MVVTGNPTVEAGPWGNALVLDGATDYVTLGAAWEDQLRFNAGTQDFSIVAWVRLSALADATIFDKRDGADDGWLLYTWTDGGDCGVGFGLDHDYAYVDEVLFEANRWYCVGASVDRSTLMTAYMNGVAGANTHNPAGEVMATTTAPRIGAQSFDGDVKFSGAIAGVVLFNRILTPAEHLALAGA